MRISDWSSDVCSSDLGKPMIVGITEANGNASDMTRYQAQNQEGGVYVDFVKPAMKKYFDVKESQWPNGEYNRHSLTWMRSEERRVGNECAVRVDLGGSRIIKKKKRYT